MYIFTKNQFDDNAKWKKIYMYLINALWKKISECVKLVPNLTHFEFFFFKVRWSGPKFNALWKTISKCVKLVPNLTHFEKNFQSG